MSVFSEKISINSPPTQSTPSMPRCLAKLEGLFLLDYKEFFFNKLHLGITKVSKNINQLRN